jgi:cell division protein FtsI (penicillin-binding protein 3)
MKDSNDEGYGVISVKEAFQVSSNVAVSKLIDRVYGKNPQKFIDKIKQFQLGNPLGISIPGEGKPRIKNPTDKDWSGVTLPWMSIGYELQITPAQILAFYNAVANNGKMVKPKFVTAVTKRGQNVKEFETEIISESIASNKAIKAAKAMLEAVVDRGTATNLRNPNFKIAGKTGTAQIANSKYGYKYDAQISYQASFVGYFPAEKPRYSIIVIVNAPSNNVYYGNLVAGPIFKEIADKVFATQIQLHKQLNIQKQNNTIPPVSKNGYAEDLNKVFKKLNVKTQLLDKDAEWIKTHVNENLITAKELKHTEVLVPNVMGMDAMDAIYLLENKGLQVKIFGRGEVKFQSKQPGSKITKGDAIMLELS